MKMFQVLLVSCIVVATTHAKDDKQKRIEKVEKLVGVWEAKSLVPSLKFLPTTAKWNFTNDGTLLVIDKLKIGGPVKVNGIIINLGQNDASFANGTFKVDGDVFSISLKCGIGRAFPMEYKAKITKLTDKEFQTKDENGMVCEFKKKDS